MARIPYPDPASSPEPVAEALAALPPLNIFRMLSHAESAFRPFLRFGGTILGRLELDPKLRELAILQVALSAEARYEWVQHEEIARHLGVPDEQIAAVERGAIDSDPSLGELERAVLQFAREVVAGPTVSDATFAVVALIVFASVISAFTSARCQCSSSASTVTHAWRLYCNV